MKITNEVLEGYLNCKYKGHFLADVPEPGSKPYFTKADFYVACSRAKHLLMVISRGGA